jgi:hypothetical protein
MSRQKQLLAHTLAQLKTAFKGPKDAISIVKKRYLQAKFSFCSNRQFGDSKSPTACKI